MSAIAPYIPKHARLVDLSLEQLLGELRPYSFVRLTNFENDDTWGAVATMRIKTVGAKFEVKSDYTQPNPKAALVQLLDRVLQAVEDLGR